MSQTPLLLGVGAIGTALVLGVLSTVRRHDPVDLGAQQIDTFYRYTDTPLAGPGRTTLSPLADRLRNFASRILPSRSTTKLQHLLDVAGNPRRWDLAKLLVAKTAAMLAVGLFGLAIGASRGPGVVLFAGGGALLGFYLPDLLVYNAGLKRQESIQKALPDSLDMLTICVEAGLGFDAGLAQVARNTEGPLAHEFARVLHEMQVGESRATALRGMADRATVPELRVFATALVQASELGIPVAAVLREQASEMRLKRRQRAEEKAQKVTVKILFPLIFCLLPALFIVVMGPGVLSILHSFKGM